MLRIRVDDQSKSVTLSVEGKLAGDVVDELRRVWTSLRDESPGTQLAVRSSGVDEDSAGHSFAGIHETKLNVLPSGVSDAVRSCWASVTSPQALAYRRAQNLPLENPKTAVLVQIMIDPIVSGV